ncbi:MAG: hypothetical protein ACRDZR_14850, partial [Acidimicrobiales bacterium]
LRLASDTPEQKVANYIAVAKSELRRSGNAASLKAQTLHATRATAAAAIAQVLIMQSGERPSTAAVEQRLATTDTDV